MCRRPWANRRKNPSQSTTSSASPPDVGRVLSHQRDRQINCHERGLMELPHQNRLGTRSLYGSNVAAVEAVRGGIWRTRRVFTSVAYGLFMGLREPWRHQAKVRMANIE
jgi:hypothetical protein